MVDKAPFTQEWIQMQQAFWSTHGNPQQTDNPSLNLWLDEVDSWWKTQATDVPSSVNSLYEKLLFSSHFFVNFAEPFITANDKNADPSSVLVEYLEVFLDAIEKETELDNDIKGFWKLPFDMWQQQIDSLGGFPDSFLELVKRSIKDDGFSDEFSQAGQNYLQALKSYQSGFVEMTMQAATELTQELHKTQNSPQPSCRKVCAIWIDIFDSHYDDFVSNSEYPKLYANVINSWMLLIKQSQQLISPWLSALNMPVQKDIDNIKAKQSELLDENRVLKQEMKELLRGAN